MTDVGVDFREDVLLRHEIFEDAFLGVFGVLQRSPQSFRPLDSIHHGVRGLDRSMKLIQALTNQSGSPRHGCPVAVEKSNLEAGASENDGPSATDKADADYCNFPRHFVQCRVGAWYPEPTCRVI